MLTDTRIIQRHGSHQVMGQRYEVMWHNGTTIGLHAVNDCGVQHAYLRAIEHAPLHWIVVDLRDLSPELAKDIPRLPHRDAIGCIFHQLRADYANASAFKCAALQKFKAAWFAGEHVGMGTFIASQAPARRSAVLA